jgi:hypothetical protein
LAFNIVIFLVAGFAFARHLNCILPIGSSVTLVRANWRNPRHLLPIFLLIILLILSKKTAIKRDGPVFFSSTPVKVAGDERTIIAIVAPHRSETQSSEALAKEERPPDTFSPIESSVTLVPVCPN